MSRTSLFDLRNRALPMRDATTGDRAIDWVWQKTGWLWAGRLLTRRRHHRRRG